MKPDFFVSEEEARIIEQDGELIRKFSHKENLDCGIPEEQFKVRSPKIYGVGKSYGEAMESVYRKSQHIANFGHYQYATIDSIVSVSMGALTYVYPSIFFYRLDVVESLNSANF